MKEKKQRNTRETLSNDTIASCSEGAVSFEINSLTNVLHMGSYIRGTRTNTNAEF